MEAIAGYDAWKTASPEEYVDQNEIDILERNLKECPFCLGKAFFEECSDGWYVSCRCGARIPGMDAQEAAAKWMVRPPLTLVKNRVRTVAREHWTGW